MSKGKEKQDRLDEKSAAAYYSLKTKAVDDLVHANPTNSPEVPESELRRYRSGLRKYKFSDWVKALFIKFWFPAAACYYMIWGLSTYVSSTYDLLFITGIAIGVLTDLLTNNLLRWQSETEGSNDHWMMFPGMSFANFFLNILYSWVVLLLVFTAYNAVNVLLSALHNGEGSAFLGVEPFLFGIFYLLFDTLLIEAKHLMARIISDAKRQG